MNPNHSPLSQIKDLLDELAVLSEKFDQVETVEVKEELAKRIERKEKEVYDAMRSLATRQGKRKLIVIAGGWELVARLRLSEGGQVEAFGISEVEAVV